MMQSLPELWHILYHGTTKDNTDLILREGFRPYTYFARGLAEALQYGGGYVFDVVFPHSFAPDWFENPLCWQLKNRKTISPHWIVRLRHLTCDEIIQENKQILDEIFRRSLEYYNRGYF